MHREKYKFQFLVNERHEGKTKTFVAYSQREPQTVSDSVFAYVKELNDFIECDYNNIIAIIKPKPFL